MKGLSIPLKVKSAGPWGWTLLLAWLSIALCEAAIGRVSAGAPSLIGVGMELGILGGFALLHLLLGRLPFLAGPFTPGALLLLVGSFDIIAGREMVQRSYPLSPGDLLLLTLAAGALGEGIESRAPRAARALALMAAPLWAGLYSLELGYYRGGRSTALDVALDALPYALPALAVVLALSLWRPWAGIPAIALGALALAYPTAEPAPGASPQSGRPNVVFITVDTLRADEAPKMEAYRRLAARGTEYQDALAPSGWTLPSMASMVTGVYPQEHGAYRLGEKWPSHGSIRPELPVMAETFKAAGYETIAVVTNPNLAASFGFRRGIDRFYNLFKDPPTVFFGLSLFGRGPDGDPARSSPWDGGLIVDDSLRWLKSRDGKPFFLWVHMLDTHLPYYHAEIAPESSLFDSFGTHPGKRLDVHMLRTGRLWGNRATREGLLDLYRQEIRYADAQLTRLLDALDAQGLSDDTIFLFTSDHGEEFLDHGGFEHGHTLYDELVRVPFILARPGQAGGEIRADPVSLVDIYPTLTKAAGLEAPASVRGRDVVEDIPPERPRYLWGSLYNHSWQGVQVGDWKLLKEDGGEAWRLYSRAEGELSNRYGEEPEIVQSLKPLVEAMESSEGAEPELDMDGLRSLGYVE